MTQYAMPTILPNTHNGTDLANFLNASYPALYSYHRGSSRPSYAIPGMIWIDSSVANVDSVVYFDGTHDILIHSFDTTTGAIIGGGPFTPGNMFHQGAIDPTIAAPASPRNGDVYVVSTAGAAHASFTGLAGTTMTVGDVIFYDGANWQALKLQSIVGSYLPLAGGTLSGNLSFSGPSVSQPFSALPANVGGRTGLQHSTNGGIQFQGASASAIGFLATSYAGIPNTLNTAQGSVAFNVVKHNGSGGNTSLASTENLFSVSNNNVVRFLMKGAGDTYIGGLLSTGGESAPDVDLGGICINTGSLDGNAMTFKNSDVAHPFTALYETDTYGIFQKFSPSAGGFAMLGFSEGSSSALYLAANMETPGTVLGTNNGAILLNAFKSNGTTGQAALSSTEIAFTIKTGNAFLTQLTGNGSLYQLGSISTGGEVAPDVATGGICINTGASNSLAFTLKNSAVTHPFTSFAEADTFTFLRKLDAAQGGLWLGAFAAGPGAFMVEGFSTAPNTSNTTSGVIRLNSRKTNGTTGATVVADGENLFSVENNYSSRFLLKGNGQAYLAGGIATGGETAPDADFGGITTYTVGGSGANHTLKNSSVNHGMTSVAETDTYGVLRKSGTTTGGLLIRGLSSGSEGLFITAQVATPNTVTGYSPLTLHASKANGTGVQAIAASESVLGIYNNSSTAIARVMGNGDVRIVGGLATGGETAPDVDLGGICINTGALDGNAMTFKNSDVAHSFTSFAEADTYGFIKKGSPTAGGLFASGFGTAEFGMYLRAFAPTPTSASSGTGNAVFSIDARTGVDGLALVGDSDNLFAVKNANYIRLLVKGNGDTVVSGGMVLGGASLGGALVDPNALKIRHSGGSNFSLITAVSSSFTNPWTVYPSDQMWALQTTSPANGGMAIIGISTDANTPALGALFVAPGSSNTGAITFNVSKHNGAGGIADMTGNEIVFRVSSGVPLLTLRGDKRMQIGGGLTTGGGNINLLGLDAFGTYIRGESAGNVLALGAGGVNQPFADMLPETTTFFNIPSSGGLKVTASAGSGMGNRPLEIVAIGGGSASVANTAMVNQKHDGSGGVTELGSTDVMFAVLNNTTPAVSVKGNGDTVSTGRFCGKVELITPASGGSTATSDSTQTLILNHSSTIATHTITLPLGRNDGQEFRIASRSAVTTLTLNASGGQTVYGGITSLTANGRATYIYSGSNTSWYRLN